MEPKYKILAASGREPLEALVSGHIRTGWKLVGAPFYVPDGVIKDKHYQFWFQAISKIGEGDDED